MHKLIAFAGALALLAAAPASAATTAQKAAVAALILAERGRAAVGTVIGTKTLSNGKGVAQVIVAMPSCFIVQAYAQCDYVDQTAWLHLKNGKWIFLGDLGEKYYDQGIAKFGSAAAMLEKQYGIPASVAKQFTGPRQNSVP